MQYDVIIIQSNEEQQELLIAVLADLGAESFWQEDTQLTVSFPENTSLSNDEKADLEAAMQRLGNFSFEWSLVQKENWNQQWEESFHPLTVADKIYIHAAFHPQRNDLPLQIEVTPKMSFGTGHHGTTSGMMEKMLEIDWNAKSVLDMGTGTGILAILAKKLGAAATVAIDNDEWAVENAIENCKNNGFADIEVMLGTDVPSNYANFDIILSNITLNYNLDNYSLYERLAHTGTYLLLSGFYAEDAQKLKDCYAKGFEILDLHENNKWGVLICRKK
jgi:ribosomal protein L11 methyltransferase